ncbi:MAG: hypothetical protein ABW185_04525 [Sedimenticola sp.]
MEESRLCKTLQPILEAELAEGNSIESIDAPAGSNCPFAINLKNRINYSKISELSLCNTVEAWENKDRNNWGQIQIKCYNQLVINTERRVATNGPSSQNIAGRNTGSSNPAR